MKGEILFEKMTDISDEYVAEAALTPSTAASNTKKSHFAALSRALNSGWGVACICLVVAIATVVGMVAWGHMGSPTNPGDDPSVRFAFSFDMTDNNGTAWSGTAYPGDTVNVNTNIVNHGKSFKTYDFFAYARFVLQEDESVVIEGNYPLVDAQKHTIENGGQGSRTFHFHVPENATPGVYDLVLSFDGAKQVFSGVLTVGEVETEGETQPPVDTTDRHDFSFGYELAGDAAPGTFYHMNTWVVNEGASFTFEGSSMGFAPSAVLIHMDTQYRIEGMFDVTTDFTEVTVKTGDKGQVTQEFMIPADAPTGAYALQLSYDGVSKSFAGVVIVAEPTVIDPAVLYNLTMPIGSDWLYEPVDEAYVDGDLITVRMRYAADMDALFLLNGEVITSEVGDSQLGYREYTFEMPKKDSEIIFRPYDSTTSYSDILEAYYKANHAAMDVVIRDYGTYGDGVRVATIEDARFEYPDMVVEHRIGPAVIRYGYSNFLQVLHNGQFCSLSEAYEAGLLSDADMAALENRQRELYPFLYADNE